MTRMLGLERSDHRRRKFRSGDREPPSRYLETIGSAGDPEPLLVVQFTGLTEKEQRMAIGGFPGGRRFVLAGPHQRR